MLQEYLHPGKQMNLPGRVGIEMIDLNDAQLLDLAIDGADEVDNELQLIKGGGGSLLQEKMIAAASKKLIVIADAGKAVSTLGNFLYRLKLFRTAGNKLQNIFSN